MKKLKVDLGELIFAFESGFLETNHYLDLETGKVIMVRDEARWELEHIYEEAYNPDAKEDFNLAEVLQQSDQPEWYQQELLETDRVEREYGSRDIAAPQIESYEGYHDMEEFIITVRDESLQDRLWDAIQGRGAFRRFKNVLAHYPRERERWFEFKDKLMQERALDWLASHGIEPIIEPQST